MSMKILYDNSRKRAGNWFAFQTGKSEVFWIWHIKLNLKYKQWFAVIKTPLFSFSKNNATWTISLCFGKRFAGFLYHW